jgi:hypothetical protein
MNKKNTLIGAALILLGISIYLRNFNIGTGSLVTLFTGLGLLYAYTQKKEQPFIIFGGIFTIIGLMAVIGDLRLFRLDVTFEAVLIVLGVIFIFMYYTKHIQGFIFPGTILPALGVHIILQRCFSDRIAGPSIFLLLGIAFYAIYFMAYMGSSGWPLIPATILLLSGIAAYAFNFKILTWSMIRINWDYIGPVLLIAAGVLILLGKLRKGRT